MSDLPDGYPEHDCEQFIHGPCLRTGAPQCCLICCKIGELEAEVARLQDENALIEASENKALQDALCAEQDERDAWKARAETAERRLAELVGRLKDIDEPHESWNAGSDYNRGWIDCLGMVREAMAEQEQGDE